MGINGKNFDDAPLCVILLLYKLGHNCEIESTGGCQSDNIDELTEVGILLPLLIKPM